MPRSTASRTSTGARGASSTQSAASDSTLSSAMHPLSSHRMSSSPSGIATCRGTPSASSSCADRFRHLAENGIAQLMISWALSAGAEWSDPLRSWTEECDCVRVVAPLRRRRSGSPHGHVDPRGFPRRAFACFFALAHLSDPGGLTASATAPCTSAGATARTGLGRTSCPPARCGPPPSTSSGSWPIKDVLARDGESSLATAAPSRRGRGAT